MTTKNLLADLLHHVVNRLLQVVQDRLGLFHFGCLGIQEFLGPLQVVLQALLLLARLVKRRLEVDLLLEQRVLYKEKARLCLFHSAKIKIKITKLACSAFTSFSAFLISSLIFFSLLWPISSLAQKKKKKISMYFEHSLMYTVFGIWNERSGGQCFC